MAFNVNHSLRIVHAGVGGDVDGPVSDGERSIVADVGGDMDMSDLRGEHKDNRYVNIGGAEDVSIGGQAQVVQQFGREP